MSRIARLALVAGTALVAVLLAAPASGRGLPEVGLRYVIAAKLTPGSRELAGRVRLSWQNPSSEPVRRVPLHLYLNAFSHEATTWLRGSAFFRGRVERLLRLYGDPWGHSTLERVQQELKGGAQVARFVAVQPDDGNPSDRTLVEVTLPEPVPGGGQLRLVIDFRARLPIPIARTGGHEDYFLVAQWFPKLGAFEPAGVRRRAKGGWAARQFHGATEFYANFADYDVTLRLPSDFVVGATGQRVHERIEGGEQVLRYRQRAVHDFAFVAGRRLAARAVDHPLPGGGKVRIHYLLPRGTEHQLPRWRRALEGSLDAFCRRIGRYPYATLTVVFPPWRGRFTGGMEYPTLITSTTGDGLWDGFPFGEARQAEGTLIHELGHQYFYGLLASDEQQDAFLDEGLTTYWQVEGMREVFGDPAAGGSILGRRLAPYELLTWQVGQDQRQGLIREAVRRRPAALFYPGAWRTQIYSRGALALATAARRFGQRKVDGIFATYFERFAFRHPDPEDLLAVARGRGGSKAAAFLREALSRRDVPDYRVVSVATRAYLPPLGRLVVDGKPLMITADNRHAHEEAGLPPWARERDGRVAVEIVDPGWVAPQGQGAPPQQAEGRVSRRLLEPTRRPRAARAERSYHRSAVRIVGPGWRQLPVVVSFEFEDGATVIDRWDGRSAWRGYRFLRPSPLARVRIDPARELLVDPHPQNNARAVEADGGFAADWGSWLAAAGQWLIGALSSWL